MQFTLRGVDLVRDGSLAAGSLVVKAQDRRTARAWRAVHREQCRKSRHLLSVYQPRRTVVLSGLTGAVPERGTTAL